MKARAALRLLDPVIKALRALEKDGCCLSMVYLQAPSDDIDLGAQDKPEILLRHAGTT